MSSYRPEGAVGGPLKRLLYGLASIWCWAVLLFNSVWIYGLMHLASLVLDRRIVFARLLHFWARLTLAMTFFRYRVEGRPELPEPSVVVANHQHFFDIIFLAAVLPPPLVFVARVEVLQIPIVGGVLKYGGHILLKRGAGLLNEAVLEEAEDKVRKGIHVIFFPEGTRSRTGEVRPFKSGAFRVASQSGAPLVPVVLAGTRLPLPRYTPYIIPTNLALRVLEPRRIGAADATSENVRDEVRDAVARGLAELERHVGTRL